MEENERPTKRPRLDDAEGGDSPSPLSVSANVDRGAVNVNSPSERTSLAHRAKSPAEEEDQEEGAQNQESASGLEDAQARAEIHETKRESQDEGEEEEDLERDQSEDTQTPFNECGSISRSRSGSGTPLENGLASSPKLEEGAIRESDDDVPSAVPPWGRDPEESEIKIRYKPKLILTGHQKGVSAVKFSPDGGWIGSCCQFLPLILNHLFYPKTSPEKCLKGFEELLLK